MERGSYNTFLYHDSCLKNASIKKIIKAYIYDGGQHEGRILAGYYGFNANISFTFQAVKNLSTDPKYLRFGPFCKFWGDFRMFLAINSFSQRSSKLKLMEIGNWEGLMLF